MFPVYKYLDSYPQPTHQRNHPPQYPHLYPGWEGVPPYAKLESPIPPVNYEPWPYPKSTECHGCCSHGYPSGFYNYRPPHSHLPPHPPLYFHGAYPPYPDSHPTYFIPPSPYSTGQPQYEYDKNIPSYHFCECSNHSRFPKSESSVKIEEQKPDIENKKDDSSGPINILNYPYPVVWFPPGYTKDRESSVKIEEHKPEKDNKKDASSSSINFPSYPYPAVWFPPGFKNGEVNKQTEAEPKFQNGWVPLEMHGNRLPKNGGEEKKNQQNGEEKKTQFPLPIIWMPGYDRPEEAQKNDLKEIDVDSGAAKDPPKLKIIPLKLLEKDNHEDKQGEVTVPGNEEKVEAAAPQNKENLVVAEKERKIRSIPVKQIEEIEKRTDENGTKKPSSPVKTSKLLPVCLRVDPMPGKKTKVSKSRSPSPPGEERSLREAHVVDSKLPKHAAEDGEGLGKRDTKVVEVGKKMTNTGKEDKEDESAAKVLAQVPVASTKDVLEKTLEERENQIPVIPSKDISGKTATEEEDKGVTAKEDHGVAEATKGQGEEVKKKSFTIEEAAVLIQSAYHGFEVRRFEPLKKLKQITRVRDQVHDIRERISSLEASAEHRKDQKQILVISEAIMGLLLQLDTIQGLHPSVREVRKAVARELVCLQEKLDSLSGLPDEETKSTVVEVLTDNSAEDGNQTGRDCSSVPEGLRHKTEELAEPPLVRDEKLDSKVEVFAELPMLEDGKSSHSSSEESAELSVGNVETSAPKMEEPVSSLVKVEVPLLEDEKTEPELEELSLPSLVKIESEFEPMEKVDQDSKPDDFLHLTMVKDGIVEKPKSQLGESVEAKSKAEESMVELANSLVKDEQPKSKMVDSIELTLLDDENAEPNFMELSPPSSVKAETEFEPVEEVETEPKSDELLQTLKDEILEETESQPEEFGEPKSKQEESMEPESELEQPSLGRGENSGEPEPKLEESEMGGETIPGSLISVAVGEKIETGSNTESWNAIVGGEETKTKETEETEPGKSATDGFMEEIESVSTKAANEPNVLENVSTQSILENGRTESKFATEFIAQTHEEILRPLVEATENAENRPLIEVESTLVDGEAVSEITRENSGIDLEVAEELGSTEAIEGDLEEKKKWAGKLEEQNEKLREIVEMLLEAGKKQLNVITDLDDRVRDLEKKLSKKKQKGRRRKMKGSSCSRVGNNPVRESSGSTALC